ncbi:MAG: cobalamin biosynthesis protein CbiX, partial [Verrucomicrobia bacterium]
MTDDFACFLFDNGSFRADSTRSLRGVAARLAERLGHPVRAVSLLHSTRVPAAEL